MKDLTKIRIAELICGFDKKKYPVYRDVDQLRSFFIRFSLNMNVPENIRNNTDIPDFVLLMNEQLLFDIVKKRFELMHIDYFKEILICLASRIEYKTDEEHSKTVEILNDILEFENLKVIFNGKIPSIVDINYNTQITLPDFSKLKDLNLLTEDVIDKGKEMAEIYFNLYCIENSLRAFINKEKENIEIPRKVNNTIIKLKKEEEERNYLPIRGDSELYYCDLIQLGDIIFHNWAYVFNKYFPDKNEHWLKTMITELYIIRCLVAHNSYVGEVERKSLDVYFNNIISQIK